MNHWLSSTASLLAAMVLASCSGSGQTTDRPTAPSDIGAAEPTSGAANITTPTSTPTRVPPPVLAASTTPEPKPLIPERFLRLEEIATTPLSQAGVHWVRNDSANLPPALDPCADGHSSGYPAVAGRQLVLVAATLWKLGRLTVYQDTATAVRFTSDLRAELERCSQVKLDGDRTMVWETKTLDIGGDEAFFVGGQQYVGLLAANVHYRGVVLRQGRAVQMFLDYGQSTIPPTPEEVAAYQQESSTLVAELKQATWAR